MDNKAFFRQNAGIRLFFCPKQVEKTQNLTVRIFLEGR